MLVEFGLVLSIDGSDTAASQRIMIAAAQPLPDDIDMPPYMPLTSAELQYDASRALQLEREHQARQEREQQPPAPQAQAPPVQPPVQQEQQQPPPAPPRTFTHRQRGRISLSPHHLRLPQDAGIGPPLVCPWGSR